MTKTWLEVALNGPWGRERHPTVPITVEECIEQGVACVEAGAALVCVHSNRSAWIVRCLRSRPVLH